MTINLNDRIGITEVGAMTLWMRSRLGRVMDVRFEHGAETAYVTRRGDRLLCVMPLPNSNMTLRDAIRLRGFGLHEMGHPLWQPDIFDIMDKNPTRAGSPLGGIFNILLDVHSESLTAQEYTGDAKALSEFAAVVGRDVYEKLAKQFKDAGNVIPPNFAKMAAVMTAARNAEGSWNIGMVIGFDKLVNELYTQDIRDKADELERKFNLTDRLVNNARDIDEWEIWELSKQIYEYLWEKDPDTEIMPPPSEGKGEGEPKEGDGKEGKGKGSGSEYGPNGEEPAEPLDEKIKVTEILFSDHYETMKGSGTGQGFDYSNYRKHSTYTPVDPATFKVTDYSKERI